MNENVKNSIFATLNAVNCNEHVEQKNGLSYLSWAWAWAEVKKAYPDAIYTIYENQQGWNYHTDGRTCWVKTGVTIDGLEHIEYLPVMDYKNKSIPANAVTSFDVNKAIQRSLTKACARHGLGLYIYAGEDLPEADKPTPPPIPVCADCGQPFAGCNIKGKLYDAYQVAQMASQMSPDGLPRCKACREKGKPKEVNINDI